MKPLYLLAALTLSSPAVAQTSLEYAQMVTKTYSLWSCSVLSSWSTNTQDASKLFSMGYETGKTFIDAVKARKIKQEDLSKHMPSFFVGKLSGPSTDFALGAMYEIVAIRTVKDIWQDTDILSGDEMRKNKAEHMYRERNCSFLK